MEASEMSASSDDCGCCAGSTIDTPVAKSNPPGLPAVAYRVGTYAEFKATLQARLSSTDFPALAALTTRDKDDWTVALGDAFACMADVLTFYQERIANESWLRTATERRSVLELARLIGFKPAPGVAASTLFAFTLEGAAGQRALAARPVSIPEATRVQSVPDADQAPQTFETVAAITARAEWNAMAALGSEVTAITPGLTQIHVAGVDRSIQPGDAILIVGAERVTDINSDRWDVRWLDAAEPDVAIGITRLAWSKALGPQWSAPSTQGVSIQVFRQRAALFGSNAPDPRLLRLPEGYPHAGLDWVNDSIDPSARQIDLDAPYPKIVIGSWVALAGGSGVDEPNGRVALYQVQGTAQTSLSKYAISGKLTRLTVDSAAYLDGDTPTFGLRSTAVLAQPDALALARRPLLYPVYGSVLVLDLRAPDLQPGQWIAVSGKRQRIAIPAKTSGISFPGDAARRPRPEESFIVLAAPQAKLAGGRLQALDPGQLDPALTATGLWRWTVADHDGTTVSVDAPAGSLLLQAALPDDETVSEAVAIAAGADGVRHGEESTTLALATPLANCYQRAGVAVNANVAPATHGETVLEIGGSGDAAQANQRFALKQAPLTYVSSSSDPSGAVAALQARVDDLLWSERPTLHGSGPKDHVYVLSQDDDGKTTVEFGDGSQGARLPSAPNNLRFSYRKGLGAAGNLRAGQITTLLTRPLGVKEVTNPAPASGGADAETLESARRNAPLRVLTLDRAVSALDYADFARSFEGIAKAHAVWVGHGRARGIHLTVAGSAGSPIPDGSATQRNLIAALRRFGDPLLPLTVQSFGDVHFALRAAVKIAADAEADKVLAAAAAALQAAYGFDGRDFGQPATIDEAVAVIQGVAGVIAVDIQQFYRSDVGPIDPQPQARLFAALPAVRGDGTVNPAELLTLDLQPQSLGVWS
jgi:predicted phage baseplate assembly protein